ncbi:hypothetical protein FIBSPDRAFT_970750, partial [Athelia psychrophila]
MGELEERLNEGPEVGLLPQDSNVASLVSSVEQMEQMDTGNAAPADAIIDLDEQSESTLFVDTAECERRMGKEVGERGQIESHEPPHAILSSVEDIDLENSITSAQKALALTPDGHPDRPISLSKLAGCYYARFERLEELPDLDNSISSAQQQALALTPD